AEAHSAQGAGLDASCERAEMGCEGQRAAENLRFFRCDRPGCEECFTPSKRSPCQRFCSPSCRQALRRVIERERQWRRRAPRARQKRPTPPCRGPRALLICIGG